MSRPPFRPPSSRSFASLVWASFSGILTTRVRIFNGIRSRDDLRVQSGAQAPGADQRESASRRRLGIFGGAAGRRGETFRCCAGRIRGSRVEPAAGIYSRDPVCLPTGPNARLPSARRESRAHAIPGPVAEPGNADAPTLYPVRGGMTYGRTAGAAQRIPNSSSNLASCPGARGRRAVFPVSLSPIPVGPHQKAPLPEDTANGDVSTTSSSVLSGWRLFP